ncbi:cellulose binding domain-containing protein [Streptomyces sp. NPDC088846]|uniref:GH12 family glycosyl hydrolase domain-containing protein n=1 Tax=Streptomyces sp. NPDC088846 TaxID=3365908 RepID=UPI003827A5F5
MRSRRTPAGRTGRRLPVLVAAAASLLLAAASMLTGAPPASAAPVTGCTQWGTTELRGGEYVYQQNEWNSEARQCVEADPATGAWSVTDASFALPTNGAPATYPASYRGCHWGACTTDSGLPLRVAELGSVRTNWSTTQVASGAYNVAMDIWFDSAPVTDGQPDGTELMIWMNHRGGVQPIGARTATVQLDGRNWDVWTGPGASGWKVISYVLQNGATELTDFDVKGLIDDGVTRGAINPAHYLIDAEAGFEIWQGGQGLGMNEFAFEASARSGGTAGALKAQYKNNDAAPGDNRIGPGLRLVNTGTAPVDLSDVTVRDRFSGESGATAYGTSCDCAVLGCSTVTHRVQPASAAGPGADHYLEAGFGGGTPAAGATTGEIQLHLNKADRSAFDETDDYSRTTGASFTDAPKVTVHVDGALVWGTAP